MVEDMTNTFAALMDEGPFETDPTSSDRARVSTPPCSNASRLCRGRMTTEAGDIYIPSRRQVR